MLWMMLLSRVYIYAILMFFFDAVHINSSLSITLPQISAFLRPCRFLGNHCLAYTIPHRTLILTLDRVREGMRNARRNKRLAELAAREVQQLAAAQQSKDGASADMSSGNPSISPEGKERIRRLEKEVKATIQEESILRETRNTLRIRKMGKVL